MSEEYFPSAWRGTPSPPPGAIRFVKLATNALGPSYMARCLPRHSAHFGGTLPDVVLAEYAVNDGAAVGGQAPVDMRQLARLLSDYGITLIILHHFAPAYLLGGSTYHGNTHTGEPVHEQLARDLQLTSASLRNATGLPSAWAPADKPALRLCAFACAFSADNIHPNPCGQRFLAQIATRALVRMLRTALAGAPEAPDEAPAKRQIPPPKCWSVVGDGSRTGHNLQTLAKPRGWALINLKAWQGKAVHAAVQSVYKFAYLARSPGARIEFRDIACSERENLRMFHLASSTIAMGRARIEIDGLPALTTRGEPHMTGYRQGQGALFVSTDFVVPPSSKRPSTYQPTSTGVWSRVSSLWRSPHASKVAVITLNESDHPSRRQYGFALNAIVCVPA